MGRALIVVSLCLAPGLAFSAWFSPGLEKLENCTAKKTLLASVLKGHSITSTLYITRVQHAQESQTAKLFEAQGLAGEIAYRPVYSQDTEVKNSENMLFTSVVYRREASFLEVFFSGVETQLYYEVKMNDDYFALNLDSFESQPFEVCL